MQAGLCCYLSCDLRKVTALPWPSVSPSGQREQDIIHSFPPLLVLERTCGDKGLALQSLALPCLAVIGAGFSFKGPGTVPWGLTSCTETPNMC